MTTEEKLKQIKEINSSIDKLEEKLKLIDKGDYFELAAEIRDVNLRIAQRDEFIARKNELLDQAEQLMK
jgi:protein-arginine kinase activator protein McsA